jgi:hypothetical protein
VLVTPDGDGADDAAARHRHQVGTFGRDRTAEQSPILAGGLRDLLGLDELPFRRDASERFEERPRVPRAGRADLEALTARGRGPKPRGARLQAIEVGVVLAPEPHAAPAVAHGDDRGSPHAVVGARHRVRVGARAGEGHQVALPDVL